MNGHRSKINSDNSLYPSFEINHFKLHGFQNILLEILAHIEGEKDRLKAEDEFIFEERTLYPYGLNVKLNNYNIENTGNIYCFLNMFNTKRKIYRKFRGPHTRSRHINLLQPKNWINILERDFLSNFKVQKIKTSVFSLKLRTLGKINASFPEYNFNNLHFKDILYDLITFRLKTLVSFNKEMVYFTLLYQQKSFDEFNLGQIIKNLNPFFPIKDINISPAYRYTTPLSKLIYNYREITYLDNDLPDT